ncbi:hypothetical protein GC170_05040 [bacterium]|nr:hypothetical protein [bacterium]
MDEILSDPVQKANYDTAVEFLKENARPESIPGYLEGIDFRQDVKVVEIKEGEILQRSGYEQNAGKLVPDGGFFAKPGTAEKDLGLVDFGTDRDSGKDRDFFQATRSFEALQSTASDFERPTENGFNDPGLLLKGGETQYFVPHRERTGYTETDPRTQETRQQGPCLERVVSFERQPDEPDPDQTPPTAQESTKEAPMFQNKEEEQRSREAMDANTQAPAADTWKLPNQKNKNQPQTGNERTMNFSTITPKIGICTIILGLILILNTGQLITKAQTQKTENSANVISIKQDFVRRNTEDDADARENRARTLNTKQFNVKKGDILINAKFIKANRFDEKGMINETTNRESPLQVVFTIYKTNEKKIFQPKIAFPEGIILNDDFLRNSESMMREMSMSFSNFLLPSDLFKREYYFSFFGTPASEVNTVGISNRGNVLLCIRLYWQVGAFNCSGYLLTELLENNTLKPIVLISTHRDENPYHRIINNANGDLLFAAPNHSLFRLTESGIEKVMKFPDIYSIYCGSPATICVDSKNRVYAYALDKKTLDYGLYRFDGANEPKLIFAPDLTILEKHLENRIPIKEFLKDESDRTRRDPDFNFSIISSSIDEMQQIGRNFLGGDPNPGKELTEKILANSRAFTLDTNDNLIIPGHPIFTTKDAQGNETKDRFPTFIKLDQMDKAFPFFRFNKDFPLYPYHYQWTGESRNELSFSMAAIVIFNVKSIDKKYSFSDLTQFENLFNEKHSKVMVPIPSIKKAGGYDLIPGLKYYLYHNEKTLRVEEIHDENNKIEKNQKRKALLDDDAIELK